MSAKSLKFYDYYFYKLLDIITTAYNNDPSRFQFILHIGDIDLFSEIFTDQ